MKFLLSICLVVFFVSIGSSQLIEKLKRNKYKYEGEIYKRQNLGFVYVPGSESAKTYLKGRRQKNTSKYLLNSAIISFLAGNGIARLGYNTNGNNDFLIGTGLVVAYILGPALYITAIPFSSASRDNFKKAVDLHNHEYIEVNGYQKDQGYLHLEFSKNGLGLVYSF